MAKRTLPAELVPPYTYEGYIVSCLDGDTVTVIVDRGWDDFTYRSARLDGINAREITGARSARERTLGEGDREYLQQLVQQYALEHTDLGAKFLLQSRKSKRKVRGRQREKLDKYGRYLLTILGYDAKQKRVVNLVEEMLAAGHGVPYIL